MIIKEIVGCILFATGLMSPVIIYGLWAQLEIKSMDEKRGDKK